MTRRLAGMPPLFVDFLFITLLAVILLINPPTDGETAAPPGTMSVVIAWPEGPIDVDLWVKAPGQRSATGYSNRGGSVVNLLRDDLGTSDDPMPLNMEHAYTRGLPAGEYIINVHGFSVPVGAVDVAVEVRKGALGERQAMLFRETVRVANRQEVTVVRFRLDKRGDVVPGSVNHVFKAIRIAGGGMP